MRFGSCCAVDFAACHGLIGGNSVDGELFPAWFLVLVYSAAGSGTFLVVKPYESTTLARTAIGSLGTFAAGTASGMALTFGVCEYMGWQSQSYHWVVAFLVSLLGVTCCRLLVQVFERDGLSLFMHGLSVAVRRLFGVEINGKREHNPQRHDQHEPPASS